MRVVPNYGLVFDSLYLPINRVTALSQCETFDALFDY